LFGEHKMSLLFSVLGVLAILFGFILLVWLVMQIEYTVKFSWYKTTATITAMSLLFGFGIHFILISAYL
jgi:membrane-bound ClpP family serine protease